MTKDYTVDSASNALKIVGMLRTRRSLTVTEVSQELGVGKSTAHRLLMTLVAEGFALRDPVKRRYHPGRALVEVGLSALGDLDVRRRTGHPMRALAEQTGETVKLLVLDGPYARVIELVEGTKGDKRIGGSVGELLPANATAGGKLLLAYEPEEELRARFERHLPVLTDRTISDWNAFAVELQQIRDRGWSHNTGEATEGISGLAVPLHGRSVQNVAALALAAPTERLPVNRHRDLLRSMFAAAAAINEAAERGSRKRTPPKARPASQQ